VWPVGVVVSPPGFDDPSGGGQAPKDVLVEAFIMQMVDQALGERVLHSLARRDVVPADAAILLPARHRM
jgi:hypothetical protein